MRLLRILLLTGLLVTPVFSAELDQGSVSVAPIPVKPPNTFATPDLVCRPRNIALKFDSRQNISWPHQDGMKIEGLDISQRHTVVVLCNGKPQQTFRFRFSEFKENKLCLFIDGLYQTVELWELKKSPWCKPK
jgi:hypothetical protein